MPPDQRNPARLVAAVRRLHRWAKHIIAPRSQQRHRMAPPRLYEGSRLSLVQAAIEEVVKRGEKSSGDAVRRDIDASDLLRAVIGVSYVGSGGDWQQSARRLVDIPIAGSRLAA